MSDEIDALKARMDALAKRQEAIIELMIGDRELWDVDDKDDLLTEIQFCQRELQEVQTELGETKEVVNPDPGRTDYEQLTREQKVHRVRKKLIAWAMNANGTARMKYKDVKKLFDNNPSDGHCYDLMRYAGEKEGFEYQTKPENRVIVNMGSVNDNALVHAVKNGQAKEGV